MISFLLAIIYLAFISLGLPDAILGAAWPMMHESLGVPLASQGIVTAIISGGTIISSMMSDKVLRRLGTGKVTAISVGMTAVALFGFSVAKSLPMLCLWAIPYGLGAGSVDAALNNFVALHYKAHHMNWLHCFWGFGATLGPYIMGFALSGGGTWSTGYWIIALIQIVLTAGLFLSLPLWKRMEQGAKEEEKAKARQIGMAELLRMTGAKQILVTFFCYCAVEATTGLWGSSYFVMNRGIKEETAASWAAIFYLGITIGRLVSGFISMKVNEKNMVRIGQVVAALGVILLAVSGNELMLCTGYIMIGLGCAPIYPALLHETPENFGKDVSQAIMGMQMACAYVGSTFMPPVFGLIAGYINIAWYPVYLFVLVVLMFAMTEYINRKLGK